MGQHPHLGDAHPMNRLLAAFATLVALTFGPLAARAVTISQVDDFESGTLASWQAGGSTNPNGPVNITTGGPAGLDDNYMRLSSNGQFGAGSKLVVFNADQWTGDYLLDGVTSIEMQVNNLGATNLVLRLIFESAFSGQSIGSLASVSVPAGSGWTTVNFPIEPANFTGGDFNAVMMNVTTLNLLHSPTPITARSASPNIAAQLGVDNIRAVPVPEPSSILLFAAGMATCVLVRRSRVG
jgi:hypothetical protein